MAIGKLAQIAARAAKKAMATRRQNLGTIRTSRADPRVESAGVTRNLPRSTSLATTSGTNLATTGGTLSRTAGTRVGTARPMRNVTPRANSRLRGALTDAAAVAGLAGIIGGAYLGNKPKKTTPVATSPKKKPSTPSRHTSKINKPPAGLKKARPTPKKKAIKGKARPITRVPVNKNRRTPTTGPKTTVEVGSSVIRNRDGSIKKVKPPSAKGRAIVDAQQKLKGKSKYARMTTSQINRLSGKEKSAYRKWKASQGK